MERTLQILAITLRALMSERVAQHVPRSSRWELDEAATEAFDLALDTARRFASDHEYQATDWRVAELSDLMSKMQTIDNEICTYTDDTLSIHAAIYRCARASLRLLTASYDSISHSLMLEDLHDIGQAIWEATDQMDQLDAAPVERYMAAFR